MSIVVQLAKNVSWRLARELEMSPMTFKSAPSPAVRRRQFLTLLGGAAAVWPLAVHAQQAVPLIGYLGARTFDTDAQLVDVFQRGLGETGHVVGKNLEVEFRWADGRYDQLSSMGTELVGRGVSVFVATGTTDVVRAIRSVTSTIPIVFVIGADPVANGLVTNLSRPGGNVTGISLLSTTLLPKLLQITLELVPAARLIGVLQNPSNSNLESNSRELSVTASVLQAKIFFAMASGDRDLETSFATLAKEGVDALFVSTDSFFTARRDLIVKLAARHAIPTVYTSREFADAGGLLGYGASRVDAYRSLGIYVGRILNGEKPVDLPVMLPTKFDLVINLKAAKALGLTMPPSLLTRADEVIG